MTRIRMDPRVVELLKRPQFAQRTPEWYEARKKCLTASDVAAALRIKPFKTYKGCPREECLQKKLSGSFFTNIFVEHGVKYEDEARDMAMGILGMKALDFGLLLHPTHEWLGASPDGITECGLCIEIKCPLRRKVIPGEVPHHYFPQVQVQMQVCGLDETLFIQYVPTSVTKTDPVLDITRVKRDDAWFEQSLPELKLFFDDYQRALETYVPPPKPPPPTCFIEDDLYDDILHVSAS